MIPVCLDIVQIGDVVEMADGCRWKVNMFADGQPAFRFRPLLAPFVIADYTPVIDWWPDECSIGPTCAVGAE